MTTHPYEQLTPDTLLNAIEACGYLCDGRIIALNSYENRVYQVGIDEQPPLIAKFYRPGRWSAAAIGEEHHFTQQLAAAEIPVVAPVANERGETLHSYAGFLFALYPRRGGRAPNLDDPKNLRWIGRFIARIHAFGATQRFRERPTLSVAHYGEASFNYLMEHDTIPQPWRDQYRDVVEPLLKMATTALAPFPAKNFIRLHGDCHPGNILWTDEGGPHFVDFDDSCNGPAIQDLWMLLSGDNLEMSLQLGHLLRGYRDIEEFDLRQLNLIEPLRALRLIHYSAWLARRWGDPAFPRHFPWFAEPRYWQEQVQLLREQQQKMAEAPLSPYYDD
ncbi:MAG: serine/threonine protein kinase [Halothiobacillaceae bacterium]|nr:MAG: serine/threonine protein kinase [Halothiobacillaceae bacterium]